MRPRIIELLDLAVLWLESRQVDCTTIDTWRRASLESRDLESDVLQLLREMRCRRFASATTGESRFCSDMYSATEERPGRDNDTARSEAPPLQRFDTTYSFALLIEEKLRHCALDRRESRLLLDEASHGTAIEATIALGARRPDRGTLAAIEHAKLQHGEIRGAPHDSAERINLPDHGSLGYSANGWIARHLADRFERTRYDRNPRSHASSSDGRLGASVTGTDDDDVEVCFPSSRSRRRHGQKLY
jgi:hypothetical protein